MQEHFETRIREPYGLEFSLGLPEQEEPRYREVLAGQVSAEELAAVQASVPSP
ncbi:hypothetical protein [Amycolatopsis orientalis]|uniref:hypothetical protein n=1 Tax=Amycolatopsis orientalis TaxID=31958 RepID=UPI00039FD2CC|nr:hypothetical protein [Amycolatopsis orientalis]